MEPVPTHDLSNFGYRVEESSLKIDSNTIKMTLRNAKHNLMYADELQLELSFFDQGIIRCHIFEPDQWFRRFRTSQYEGVEWT